MLIELFCNHYINFISSDFVDDTISIALDTFHDHRDSYLFRTNPLGTQYDALVTDEGRTVNANWDERWDVAGRVHEGGWSAEFSIPFKSLRTNEEDGSEGDAAEGSATADAPAQGEQTNSETEATQADS